RPGRGGDHGVAVPGRPGRRRAGHVVVAAGVRPGPDRGGGGGGGGGPPPSAAGGRRGGGRHRLSRPGRGLPRAVPARLAGGGGPASRRPVTHSRLIPTYRITLPWPEAPA